MDLSIERQHVPVYVGDLDQSQSMWLDKQSVYTQRERERDHERDF